MIRIRFFVIGFLFLSLVRAGTVVIPHLAGAPWTTRLVLYNPSPAAETVQLQRYTPGGAAAEPAQAHTVPARGLTEIRAEDAWAGGIAVITSPDGSPLRVKLSYRYADTASVCEFFLPDGGAGQDWLLPNPGLAYFEWFGLAVANPGEEPLQVECLAYRNGERVGTAVRTVGAKQRLALLWTNLWEGLPLDGFDLVTLHASAPIPPPLSINGNAAEDRHLFFLGQAQTVSPQALLQGANLRLGEGENHPARLRVHGSPYEMGFQQGYLLKDRIQDVFSRAATWVVYLRFLLSGAPLHVLTPLEMLPVYVSVAGRTKDLFLGPLGALAPEAAMELHGLADGLAQAGGTLSFDDILLMNALPDALNHDGLLAYVLDLPASAVAGRPPSHQCTGFVAWGPATADSRLLHGANLDFATFGVLPSAGVVLVAKPDLGHPFAAVSFPGIFPMTGLNARGVGVNDMTSESADADLLATPRLPHGVTLRRLIQHAGSLAEAEAILQTDGETVGWNNLVSDAQLPSAKEFACSTTKMAALAPWDDPATAADESSGLVSTNQCLACPGFRGYEGENLTLDQLAYDGVSVLGWGVGPTYLFQWLNKFRDPNYLRSESWDRWLRGWDLFGEHYGRLSVPRVQDIMSDQWTGSCGGVICEANPTEALLFNGAPVPHLQGPDRPVSFETFAAVYSCIIAPSAGTHGVLWVAMGARPAQAGPYVPFDLAVELGR